jgi:internalin A
MEQFDLSYKTLQNKEISLVVECLPEDMPAGLNDKWKAIKAHKSCKEISMRYELDVIPAGIPTWFIARSHRFTTNTHWIKGALFADENKRHFAQIQAFLDFKYLELTVCGPSPNNFFVLLRDGLEVTLNRYQGLQIKRLIRCPGHNGKECPYEFEYEYLQKLIEKNRFAAECKKTLEEVPITELLFGMHIGVNDALQEEMRKMREQMSQGFAGIEEQLQDAIKLSQRQFIDQYKREQSNIDTQCPNVFVLRCNKSKTWREKFTDNVFELQLYRLSENSELPA